MTHTTNCGEPTLFVTMSARTSASASGGTSLPNDAPAYRASAPTSTTIATRTTITTVMAAEISSTPGPVTWNVRISMS